MGWCMNHRGTSVHFVPKESTNTQGQIICRGSLPHSIGITTTLEADSSLLRHVRVNHMDKDTNDPQLREVLAQRCEGGSRGRRRRLGS